MRASWLSLVLMMAPLPALAGETDQYYAWYVRVPDSTVLLDAHINRGFERALRDVNEGTPEAMSCTEVAGRLLHEHRGSGVWFPLGTMTDWRLRHRPVSEKERRERYYPVSLYRYFPMLPLAFVMPLDPTVRAAGVHFGIDKIGHILTNSMRYWVVYEAARAEGESTEEAMRRAVELGIEQENGIMGIGIGSTFSYADLESNIQGLELIRAWCEGGELALVDGTWRLKERFSIARWVNPCWDESFYPNAYTGPTAEGVLRALPGYCSRLEDERVASQRASYVQRGCHSFSVKLLDELIAAGEVPDPTPFSVEKACGLPQARVRADSDGSIAATR